MTTLAAYLERATTDADRAERATLFEDLAVWRAGDDIRGHFARFPVVLLSFKDLRARAWTDCRAGIAKVIAEACQPHASLIKPRLSGPERDTFDELCSGTADDVSLRGGLKRLSTWLHAAM